MSTSEVMSTESQAQTNHTLPSEILFPIIADLFVEYLDDCLSEETPSESNTEPGTTKDRPENLLVSLLQVSYQVRDITLKVVSAGLAIARDDEGSGRLIVKPWPRIHEVIEARNLSHAGDARKALGLIDGPSAPSVLMRGYLLLGGIWDIFADKLRSRNPRDPVNFEELMQSTIMKWSNSFDYLLAAIKPAILADRLKPRVALFLWSGTVVVFLLKCKESLVNACRVLIKCEAAPTIVSSEDIDDVWECLTAILDMIENYRSHVDPIQSDLNRRMGPFKADLSYEMFELIDLLDALYKTKYLKCCLSQDRYQECRSSVKRIVDYWANMYDKVAGAAELVMEEEERPTGGNNLDADDSDSDDDSDTDTNDDGNGGDAQDDGDSDNGEETGEIDVSGEEHGNHNPEGDDAGHSTDQIPEEPGVTEEMKQAGGT